MRGFKPRYLGVGVLLLLVVSLAPGTAKAIAPPMHLTYPSTACPQSSTGLNNCMNNVASPGSTITIKPGTYFESGSQVNQPLTIQGTACPSTIIDQGVNGDGLDVYSSDVTIKCLTFRHGGSTYEAIYSSGVNNNLHISHVFAYDEYYGVYVNTAGATGLQIENSTIQVWTNMPSIRTR